jgi:hypothetical protein
MSVHAEPPPSIVSEPHGINYATSNQLGKGGFAICFKAERLERDQPTGHVVALKIVKSRMEPAKLAQKVRSCSPAHTVSSPADQPSLCSSSPNCKSIPSCHTLTL